MILKIAALLIVVLVVLVVLAIEVKTPTQSSMEQCINWMQIQAMEMHIKLTPEMIRGRCKELQKI